MTFFGVGPVVAERQSKSAAQQPLMPPAYVKPYVKWQKNDVAHA